MRRKLSLLGIIFSHQCHARYVEEIQHQHDEVGGIFIIVLIMGIAYVVGEFKKSQKKGMLALGISCAAIGMIYLFPILGAFAGLLFAIGMIYFMFSNS